jgi:hypothetical protein
MFRQSRAGGMTDSGMLRRLVRGLCDERGQDIIESVLLTAAIGLAGLATWPLIETSIRTAYQALDSDTQELWEPPSPGGGVP